MHLARVLAALAIVAVVSGCGGGQPSVSETGLGWYRLGSFEPKSESDCVGRVVRASDLKDSTLRNMISDDDFTLPKSEESAMERTLKSIRQVCRLSPAE